MCMYVWLNRQDCKPTVAAITTNAVNGVETERAKKQFRLKKQLLHKER